MATEFSDYVDAIVTDTYQVQLKIDSEYWLDIEKYMHAKIIPHHIFNDATGIGYEGWNTWDPEFTHGHPNVVSGPFIVSDRTSSSYELARNTDYYWPVDTTSTTDTTTTTVTSTDTTTTTSDGVPTPIDTLTIIIIAGSVGVILVVIVLFYKTKQT
jgi:ABC-type transport system substrate-binding protein